MATDPAIAAQIDCGDYRDFLAGLDAGSVDLLLTDPPYGISRETGFANVRKGVQRFAVSMDFGEWDHFEIDLDAFASGAYRVLRPGGTAIVFYDLWKLTSVRSAFEQAGFSMFRLVVWQKTNPVPLNSKATYLSNSREIAVACVKGGRPTFHGSYDNGVYTSPIPRFNGNRIHPTQKPDTLFEELITKHSNPGDLVVDPFLGSGTTAVAALGGGPAIRGLRHRSTLCRRCARKAELWVTRSANCSSNSPTRTRKVSAEQSASQNSKGVTRV